MAHIGQELALGLVCAFRPHLFGGVFVRQIGQLGLTFLQTVYGTPQRLAVLTFSFFLSLDGADIEGGQNPAALTSAPFRHAQPAPVLEFCFKIARMTIR